MMLKNKYGLPIKILDLYCGVGGASSGISLAGYYVEGVDISYQRNYPFKFHMQDALKYDLDGFDGYFASPPCQQYSNSTAAWRRKNRKYPDLIEKTRERLLKTGKPFVIENVPQAPLRYDLALCMSMFDDGRKLMVHRHRVFEIHGFHVPQPLHPDHTGKIGDGRTISVYGHGGGQKYNHASSLISDWKIAMGIDWAKHKWELAEAIPPEYTAYIFSYFPN